MIESSSSYNLLQFPFWNITYSFLKDYLKMAFLNFEFCDWKITALGLTGLTDATQSSFYSFSQYAEIVHPCLIIMSENQHIV